MSPPLSKIRKLLARRWPRRWNFLFFLEYAIFNHIGYSDAVHAVVIQLTHTGILFLFFEAARNPLLNCHRLLISAFINLKSWSSWLITNWRPLTFSDVCYLFKLVHPAFLHRLLDLLVKLHILILCVHLPWLIHSLLHGYDTTPWHCLHGVGVSGAATTSSSSITPLNPILV